jgi:hypothetical protein
MVTVTVTPDIELPLFVLSNLSVHLSSNYLTKFCTCHLVVSVNIFCTFLNKNHAVS